MVETVAVLEAKAFDLVQVAESVSAAMTQVAARISVAPLLARQQEILADLFYQN